MAEHSFYAAQNVSLTVDGIQAMERGLWDGDDAIAVEQTMDVGSLLEGADGSSIFSQSASHGARITIRVMDTSYIHRMLLQRWKRQRAGVSTAVAVTLLDRGSGEGGAADRCYIMQAPSAQKGRNASVRAWVLVTGDWEPNETTAAA